MSESTGQHPPGQRTPPAPPPPPGPLAPSTGGHPTPRPGIRDGTLPPPWSRDDAWHVLSPLVTRTGRPPAVSGPVLLTPVPVVEGPQELNEVLALVREAVPARQDAVVVLPTWGPYRQRETWETARALLSDRRLLLVDTALPPLAAQLLVETLAALAAHVQGVGDLAVAAGAVEASAFAGAWVGSVTGLEHVDVPMTLHVRSLVSRRGFLVRVHPTSDVTPITRGHAAEPLVLPTPATRVVATTDGGDEGVGVVGQLLGDHPTRRIDPPPATRSWWGCDRVAEVAAVSADLQALAAAARTQAARCPWCGGMAAIGRPCPRCGASGEGPLAPIEHAPPSISSEEDAP